MVQGEISYECGWWEEIKTQFWARSNANKYPAVGGWATLPGHRAEEDEGDSRQSQMEMIS